jgi:hypothetical protein
MEVKLFTKLNNYDNDELFAKNKQSLNSHGTVHS